MKVFFSIIMLAMIAASSLAADTPKADPGKNCYDVIFGVAGTDYAEMLKGNPEEWDFRFRPYGKSSDWLWSDSNVKRSVGEDGTEDQNVTALRVSCTDDGFDVLAYCSEPDLATYLEKGGACPREQIEYFVAPGDADTPEVQRHYMGFYGNRKNRFYPNLVHDRFYRDAKPEISETQVGNALVVRFHYDWRLFWDIVPTFPKKADNFWRLSIIRWNGGGKTWGGTVHQNSQAGYIRWPAFTAEQRTALLKKTLEKGYEEFLDIVTMDNRIAVEPRTKLPNWKFREEIDAANPHSYVNVNSDPGFRAELEALVAERKALAPAIAKIGELNEEEQKSFYMDTAAKLFNFRYDVQAAYKKYLEKLLAVSCSQ